MNLALLKATLKANYKLWIIMFTVLVLYSVVIISMFDPSSMDAWQAMLGLFPQEILNAMNFNILEATFLGYIAGYYYGFIIIMFPMIYVFIMGQRSIVKHVDSGSMSFLLSTPNTRKTIAITQGFYMLMSTVALLLAISLLIGLFGATMYPGDLDFLKFSLMNVNVIGLFVLLGGISFLTGCIFNETRAAIGFGAGITIGFFVIDMLSKVSPDLSWLKFFTVFSLFSPTDIIDMDPVIYWQMFAMYGMGLILYSLGVMVFMKKDLHV
ncbi:MAG: ABC transporter permease subunit [Acholeplasmataceae bacterium]|nr:ABC transporter permease subunit [Acholeplasmataceae bacterium]